MACDILYYMAALISFTFLSDFSAIENFLCNLKKKQDLFSSKLPLNSNQVAMLML